MMGLFRTKWSQQWRISPLLLAAITLTLVVSSGCQLQSLQPTPATPQTIYLPSISAAPPVVAANNPITVSGAAWSPGESVQLILAASSGATLLQRNLVTTTVDNNGFFSVTFLYPNDALWLSAQNVRVVAHSLQSTQQATVPLTLPTTIITPTTPIGTVTVPVTISPSPAQTAVITASTTPGVSNGASTATSIATAVEAASPAATFTAAPTAANVAQVIGSELNLRRGPDTRFDVLRTLPIGERITILGRDSSGQWLYVRTSNQGEGWVSARFTNYTGAAPVVPAPPFPTAAPATPTPTPPVINNWRGEYYANPSLIGAPALVRDDANINFYWGYGSPAEQLPADNFSVRWSRSLYFDGGDYLFSARVDDGVRVWIDGDPVIDQWTTGSERLLTAYHTLSSGYHLVRVEYFEAREQAVINVWSERVQNYPDWKGEYFNNRVLSGSPQVVRNDAQIDFDWGTGSPDNNLPSDNFSVRWTRNQYFSEGLYRFHILVDDGMTLAVDGNRLIDQWYDGSQREVTSDRWMSEGNHFLQVEYYESGNQARAKVWWERLNGFTDWKGEYWSNVALSGNPTLVRNDGTISFNWGNGSPAAGLPSDNFSARWTRDYYFTTGHYRFNARVDDGFRLYVNDNLVIDQWHDNDGNALYTADLALSGTQRLRVEYYERSATALIDFWWQQLPEAVTPTWTPLPPDTATPTLVPTATNTPPATATPTATQSVPPTATATNVPATATSAPPATNTATETSVPTATATTAAPTATATTVPPTATDTSVPPTATPTATVAPTATNTPVPPTDTPTSAPTATPLGGAIAFIDPAFGGGGSEVRVAGNHFPANATVNVHVAPFTTPDPAQLAEKIYATTTTNKNGDFTLTFTVPSIWPDGTAIPNGRVWVVLATEDFQVMVKVPFRFSDQPAGNPS
ncbi:MAG: PA14 domain-containing protein [Caldilineaceae bacterium]